MMSDFIYINTEERETRERNRVPMMRGVVWCGVRCVHNLILFNSLISS